MRLNHLLPLLAAVAVAGATLPAGDGYRGIWYYNQPSGDQYHYKYSGGFATYPQQHVPIAIYSKEANKTFFVYGGTTRDRNGELVHMVSYYDHATGMVPRPRILLNKKTTDAHDNPTLAIDDRGYLWIFSAAHGTSRRAYLHRSVKPYSIDAFEQVLDTNFSYPQPWWFPGKGFLFLHTRYQKLPEGKGSGRALHWMTSADGRVWSEPRLLSFLLMGHYQVSWPHDGRLGTAFNVHPPPLGLNQRTNLYYLETSDMGLTWKTVDGRRVETPLRSDQNPALVRDYRKEGLLVYLKDLNYDQDGRPVIVYLTSKGYESGPKNGPRLLHTARWDSSRWIFRPMMETDHNYDYGSLYLEADGTWRFIGPTAPGPQAYGTGGEIEMWLSRDQGQTWKKVRTLTRNSRYNHTYVRRPVNAHPDFYALWADGDAFAPSPSRLYFTNQAGDKVWRLPVDMKKDVEKPEPVTAGR